MPTFSAPYPSPHCALVSLLLLVAKATSGFSPLDVPSSSKLPLLEPRTHSRGVTAASAPTSTTTELRAKSYGDDDAELERCVSVLRKAAQGGESAEAPDEVYQSFEALEKLTGPRRCRGLDGIQTDLNGKWTLVLAAHDTHIEVLPAALRVIKTIDTENQPMLIDQGFFLGRRGSGVHILSLSGNFKNREGSSAAEIVAEFDEMKVLDVPIKLTPEESEERNGTLNICSYNDTATKTEVEGADAVGESRKQSGIFGWVRKILRRGVSKIMRPFRRDRDGALTLMSGTWQASFTAGQEKGALEAAIDRMLGLDKKKFGDRLGDGLIRMEQSLNLLDIPAGFQWDVYTGDYLVARLLGTAGVSLSDRLLPDNISLTFGRIIVLGVQLDLVKGTAGLRFTLIHVDRDIAVAKGEDGDFYLYKRME